MKKGLTIVVLLLVLLYSAGGVTYYFLSKKEKVQIENIAEIKGYPYVLKSNATKLMKTEFEELKVNLESDEIDTEEYAKSIAKMFIIDLYTISNKTNKYDIGGNVYIWPDAMESYNLNVKSTLYKYVEDNSLNKRQQKLPEVNSIAIDSIDEIEYKITDEVYNALKIKLSWEYLENLDYDNEGEVIIVFQDNINYVVEKK